MFASNLNPYSTLAGARQVGDSYPWVDYTNKPERNYVSSSAFGKKKKTKRKKKTFYRWAINKKNNIVKVFRTKKTRGRGFKKVYSNGKTCLCKKLYKTKKQAERARKARSNKKKKGKKKRKKTVKKIYYVYIDGVRKRRTRYVKAKTGLVRSSPRSSDPRRGARGETTKERLQNVRRGTLPCYQYSKDSCNLKRSRCRWDTNSSKCVNRFGSAFGRSGLGFRNPNKFNYQLYQQANNVATPSVSQMNRSGSGTAAYDYPMKSGMSNYAYYKGKQHSGYGF